MASEGRAIAAVFRRRFFPTTHEENVREWVARKGDKTLRMDYPLSATSTVLDIGGYEGQWASDIFGRYCCTVEAFEPWPLFARQIKDRFRDNPAVTLHPYGLGGRTRTEVFYSQDDSTSAFQHDAGVEGAEVSIRAVAEVWAELGLGVVDLVKINIEGGEYELLEQLIRTGLVHRIRDIQVQFHEFVPDANARYRDLHARLKHTHSLTYSIPFVWENWTLTPKETR